MESQDGVPARRSRGDRFVLTPQGVDAEAAYRSSIIASRVEAGRASYDAARNAWAHALSLQPDDGVYLGAVRDGIADLGRLVEALEPCGIVRKDADEALRRLVDAGFVAVETK